MGKQSKRERASADVLFTELVVCERVGDIFYAGGRSHEYTRRGAMTADYVRALVTNLGKLLAEYDAERGQSPVFDGIELSQAPDKSIRFALSLKGESAASGAVTEAVARKAKAWLQDTFDPPKVVKLRSAG